VEANLARKLRQGLTYTSSLATYRNDLLALPYSGTTVGHSRLAYPSHENYSCIGCWVCGGMV
jgi:hypothetical protein